MRNLKKLLFIVFLMTSVQSFANLILVKNLDDNGTGSLRWAFAQAVPGDTIMIDVSGKISLKEPITINNTSNITLLGAYPRHDTIAADPGWVAGLSLFNINNSFDIKIEQVGFNMGFQGVRAIDVFNTSGNAGAPIKIDHCLFEAIDNTGLPGGAIQTMGQSVEIVNCSFVQNKADRGGAIFINSGGNTRVMNCTFWGNVADNRGGALYIQGSGNVILLHNTFYENNSVANLGEVIFADVGTSVSLQNNASAGNSSDIQFFQGGGGAYTSLGGNVFKMNSPLDVASWTGGSDITSQFLAPGLRSSILEDGFGLKYFTITSAGSPYIDAGTTTGLPPTDQRGAPRILFGGNTPGRPDAGACEYTQLRVTNAGGGVTGNTLLNALTLSFDPINYIEFDITTGSPPFQIQTTSTVTISNRYIIDGYSQIGSKVPGPEAPGNAGVIPAELPIEVDGGAGIANGLSFSGNSHNSVISGLRIKNFQVGIFLQNVNQIQVKGCEIGLDQFGSPAPNGHAGIYQNGGGGCVIGGNQHWMRNVTSGNGGINWNANIAFSPNASNTAVVGNIIGLDKKGLNGLSPAPPSGSIGVRIDGSDHFIGGPQFLASNIISGNTSNGITDLGSGSTIQHNIIGLDYNGVNSVPNDVGILLDFGSDFTMIGGTSGGKTRNIISGNTNCNLKIFYSQNASIYGNYIGLDLTGNNSYPTMPDGIVLDGNTIGNLEIGGVVDSAGNVISGHVNNGISVVSCNSGVVIQNNFIGTNALGSASLPNVQNGIHIQSGAAAPVTIGAADLGNVISGNGLAANGILMTGSGGHKIIGNVIGLDATATTPLGNGVGINVDGASMVVIGGDSNNGTLFAGEGNIISANGSHGILVHGDADSTQILGNLIGLDASISNGIGNGLNGIKVETATKTIIGGQLVGERNIIGGHTNPGGAGIFCELDGVKTEIANNLIGVNSSGLTVFSNETGIRVANPHEASIGGDPGKENVVCASPLVGMFIASPNVELDGNIVGIGIGNISALHSNLDGIVIQASDVSIGNSPTRINVVANNTRHGIHLDGDVADNVTIGNCRIGVDQTNIAYGNGANGILIVDGDNNLIGTTGHNFIAANDSNGVHITGNASGNVLENSEIGDYLGTVGYSNNRGVFLSNGATNNIIGGPIIGSGNDILGNTTEGIRVENSPNNTIVANNIGTNGAAIASGNSAGIVIENSDNTLVGGEDSSGNGKYNVISYNLNEGILVNNSNNTTILGNRIGLNITGNSSAPNNDGIVVSGTSTGTIIGSSTNQFHANTISGNSVNGIVLLGVSGNMVYRNKIGTDFPGTGIISPAQLNGVVLTSGASGNYIGGARMTQGNLISGNDSTGVLIEQGANNNVINGNLIGTVGSGNQPFGILMQGSGVSGNLIGQAPAYTFGNIITQHSAAGIKIDDNASSNIVQSNRIGIDTLNMISGSTTQAVGVLITASAGNLNLIGHDISGGGNVISGNLTGIMLDGVADEYVYNNYIGVDTAGLSARPNTIEGVLLTNGANVNKIGGGSTGQSNLISGNNVGIRLKGTGTDNNNIEGNLIGLSAGSSSPISNDIGVLIENGPQFNFIGIAGAGSGNSIHASTTSGVSINAASSNHVVNNLIGTLFPNIVGVTIQNNSSNNVIGGAPADKNVISGNDSIGVLISSSNTNFLSSNYIGLAPDGQSPMGNKIGVQLLQGTDNHIGTATAGEQNIISANTNKGVQLAMNSNANFIQNNFFGTGASGNQVFGGTGNGDAIHISFSNNNLIGGNSALEEGNVVCFSDDLGIWLENASGTTITGNNIGIAKDNGTYLGNAEDGIRVDIGSQLTTIGQSGTGFKNVITDNKCGIRLAGSSQANIQNNFIGNDHLGGIGSVSGTNDQLYGIVIQEGANTNTISGLNIISGNDSVGVGIGGVGCDNNIVQGNRIGVDINGSTSYPNAVGNVFIGDSAKHNLIGGASSIQRNIIGGDAPYMVVIQGSGTDSNQIAGNYIGLGLDESTMYDADYGIMVQADAKFNTLGGGLPNQGNTIVGFNLNGIRIAAAQNQSILGNRIGILPDNSPGTIDSAGVLLLGGDNTWIGAYLPGSDSINVITNCNSGVDIATFPLFNNTYATVVGGNSIYNNVNQGIDINADDMVLPIDTMNNNALLNNGEIDRPEIVAAWNCNGTTHVGFKFYASNNFPNYNIQFYTNSVADVSGYGEGENFLGNFVFSPATNHDTISVDLGQNLPLNTILTATITGVWGNTSEFSEQYLVTDPPIFPVPPVGTETCLGAFDGEIEISAPGAHYFSIDGGTTVSYGIDGDTIINIVPGAYTVMATYLNGCVLTQPAIVNTGPPLAFGYNILPDTCGMGVGSIVIDTVSTNQNGGTGEYTYSFDNGSTYGSNIGSFNLTTGNYNVGLLDTNLGCYSNIDMIAVPEITDVVDESFDFLDFCPDSPSLPTNIITSGGSWDFVPPVTDGAGINSSTGEITSAVVGNSYQVVYTVGVCSETDTVLVMALPLDDASFTYASFCLGSTPTITTATPGGDWSLASGPGSIDAVTGVISGTTGSYDVVYKTNGACTNTDTLMVAVYDSPAVPQIVNNQPIYCPNDSIQAITTAPITGLSYDWYNDAALTNNVGTGISYTPASLSLGDNLFYLTATDVNGCVSQTDTTNYYGVDVNGMAAGADQEVCMGAQTQLDAAGGSSYQWSSSFQFTGSTDISNPEAQILLAEDFIVLISDMYGCSVMDTLRVTLLPQDQCSVDVYNAFSPNNDGVNDFWEIDGIEGFPENTVIVYNRWGDALIRFQNYNNADVIWDGVSKDGRSVSAGTYFYIVDVGGTRNQAGWVQVMK